MVSVRLASQRAALLVALTALTLALAVLGGAEARADRDPAGFEVVTADVSVSAEAIAAYWTPERMEAAVPMDAPRLGPAPPDTADDAVGDLLDDLEAGVDSLDLVDPAVPPTDEFGALDAAHFSHNTGKLFFRTPSGQNRSCSASAINSDSKRLVLTAGHCIHEGGGGDWMQNVAFVPAYSQGNRPYGTFPWRVMTTFTGWINNSDRKRDVGMVVTAPNESGQILVNTVGGHGFSINPSRQTYVHIVGYPGNRDNGQIQWNCWGTTSRWSLFDGGLKLSCGWEHGSSGSPWLRDYQSNGLGYAMGVMHGFAGADNYSPYFDNAVGDMYDDMKDRT